jgi:HEAT repeat protein
MADDLEKVILESLDKEDPNLLRAACLLAGMLKLTQAERGLLKALGHKAWQVQAEAARSLGLIGSKGAVPFLKRLLKATDADLRQKVLAGASASGKAEAEAKDEAPPELRRAAAVAISRLEPKAAQEALMAALASDNPSLMGAAMAGLATLEAESGRDKMVELLTHADPTVRRAAATALGKLSETKAVPGLMSLLGDTAAEVRKEAVIALNHIKDRQALPALAACLEDTDPEVRRVAAIALGNTRLRQAPLVQALVKGLKDREPGVRLACLSALGNLKAAEALEAAAALMADSHEAVARQAAVTAVGLGQIRERPDYEGA